MKFTLNKEAAQTNIEVGGVPRVNLLPASVTAKRALRSLLVSWGIRLGFAVVALIAAVAAMLGWQAMIAMQLSEAKAQGDAYLQEIASKGDIQSLMNTERSLEEFVEESMSTDISWVNARTLIEQHLPEGTTLFGFNLTVGGVPSGEPAEAVGLSGTVTVCSPIQLMVPYLRDTFSVEGLMDVRAVSGEETDDRGYVYTVDIVFSQLIYLSIDGEDEDTPEAYQDPEAEVATGEDTE